MGNRRSRLSQRRTTTIDITTDSNEDNFEHHRQLCVRNLCSQTNCFNFEDLANNMSFCTQCYTKYMCLLSACPSDTTILDQSSAKMFNSHEIALESPSHVSAMFTSASERTHSSRPSSQSLFPDSIVIRDGDVHIRYKSIAGDLYKSTGDEDFEIIPAVPDIPEIRPPDYSTSTSSQRTIAAKPSKPVQHGASTLSKEPDSRGVIVKTMRDALLCPICLELLEDAKTLPCQHTVCKDCLSQWVASKGELRCPTCNTRQRSTTRGVEGLPSNFTLNSLVAEMKKMDIAQMEAEASALRMQESDDSVKSQSISTVISGASPLDGLHLHSLTEHTLQQDIPVANMSFFQNLDESFNLEGSAVRMKIQLCNAGGHPLPATNSDTVEELEVTLCDPTGAEVHLNIDKCDGDFCVTFVAHEVGTHIVHALLGGEAIVGSPAVVEIYTR